MAVNYPVLITGICGLLAAILWVIVRCYCYRDRTIVSGPHTIGFQIAESHVQRPDLPYVQTIPAPVAPQNDTIWTTQSGVGPTTTYGVEDTKFSEKSAFTYTQQNHDSFDKQIPARIQPRMAINYLVVGLGVAVTAFFIIAGLFQCYRHRNKEGRDNSNTAEYPAPTTVSPGIAALNDSTGQGTQYGIPPTTFCEPSDFTYSD